MEKTEHKEVTPLSIPHHIRILQNIKNICLQSKEPFQTVAEAIAFLNALISQAEKGENA